MAAGLFLGHILRGGAWPTWTPPVGSTVVSVFDKYNEMYRDVNSDRLTIGGLSMTSYHEIEQGTRTV